MTARRDAVVVGGGVIGLATALELARAGRDVTVISDGQPVTGASAGNAGMLVPSHVVPLSAPGVVAQGLRWMLRRDAPFQLRLRADPALLSWLWRFWRNCNEGHVQYAVPVLRDLSLLSMEGFRGLAREADDFHLASTGLMMVYRTEALERSLAHEADIAEAAGLDVRRLNREGVMEAEPHLRSEVRGAILFPQDGRVDPEALMRSLSRRVLECGGRLEYGRSVKAVGRGWVDCGTERFEARDIVLAAGAWSPRLVTAGRRMLPIQPAKGYSVTLPKQDPGLSIPMILMEERVTVTPLSGKIRFGGTLSLAGFDRSVDPTRVSPILREAARYADPDQDVSALPVWCGYRPASPDGLPMIGRLDEGLWACTGHGMLGVSLAPASGRLLADLMLGQTPHLDPAPFDPRRFL